MAKTQVHRKGKWEYGRRVKSSGGAGKTRGKRRVWLQAPGQKESRPAQRRFEEPVVGSKVYGPFKTTA